MSEKRFDFNLGACKIYDKQEERLLEDTEVCGLLNEQDKTIKNQEQRIKILQQEIQSAQQIGILLSERLKGFCGDGV